MATRGCCGGSDGAAPIMEAKGFWLNGGLKMSDVKTEDGAPVLLEFVGAQAGSIRYVGKESGNVYIAGNNSDARVNLFDPRDVDHFLNLRDQFSKKPLFARVEPESEKEQKKYDAAVAAAPPGMEWNAGQNAYVPIGMEFDALANRWIPRAEVEANGIPETDADGNPIVDAFAAGEVGRTIAPDQNANPEATAIAADLAAAKNTKTADELADLPAAKDSKKAK